MQNLTEEHNNNTFQQTKTKATRHEQSAKARKKRAKNRIIIAQKASKAIKDWSLKPGNINRCQRRLIKQNTGLLS